VEHRHGFSIRHIIEETAAVNTRNFAKNFRLWGIGKGTQPLVYRKASFQVPFVALAQV